MKFLIALLLLAGIGVSPIAGATPPEGVTCVKEASVLQECSDPDPVYLCWETTYRCPDGSFVIRETKQWETIPDQINILP